jgi:hypothetical protein
MPRDRAQQALPDRNYVSITMRDNVFFTFRKAVIGPKIGKNSDNTRANFEITTKSVGYFVQYGMMIDLDVVSIMDL